MCVRARASLCILRSPLHTSVVITFASADKCVQGFIIALNESEKDSRCMSDRVHIFMRVKVRDFQKIYLSNHCIVPVEDRNKQQLPKSQHR